MRYFPQNWLVLNSLYDIEKLVVRNLIKLKTLQLITIFIYFLGL